jgi:hypothetical protein
MVRFGENNYAYARTAMMSYSSAGLIKREAEKRLIMKKLESYEYSISYMSYNATLRSSIYAMEGSS